MKKLINSGFSYSLGIFGITMLIVFYNMNRVQLGVDGLIVNIFLILTIFILILGMILVDIKWLKKTIIGFVILMVIISMTSCGVTRVGCPQHYGFSGY